jgi:hypothetical protein
MSDEGSNDDKVEAVWLSDDETKMREEEDELEDPKGKKRDGQDKGYVVVD